MIIHISHTFKAKKSKYIPCMVNACCMYVTVQVNNWACDWKAGGSILSVNKSQLESPYARHLTPNCSPGTMVRAAHHVMHMCFLLHPSVCSLCECV